MAVFRILTLIHDLDPLASGEARPEARNKIIDYYKFRSTSLRRG